MQQFKTFKFELLMEAHGLKVNMKAWEMYILRITCVLALAGPGIKISKDIFDVG